MMAISSTNDSMSFNESLQQPLAHCKLCSYALDTERLLPPLRTSTRFPMDFKYEHQKARELFASGDQKFPTPPILEHKITDVSKHRTCPDVPAHMSPHPMPQSRITNVPAHMSPHPVPQSRVTNVPAHMSPHPMPQTTSRTTSQTTSRTTSRATHPVAHIKQQPFTKDIKKPIIPVMPKLAQGSIDDFLNQDTLSDFSSEEDVYEVPLIESTDSDSEDQQYVEESD